MKLADTIIYADYDKRLLVGKCKARDPFQDLSEFHFILAYLEITNTRKPGISLSADSCVIVPNSLESMTTGLPG